MRCFPNLSKSRPSLPLLYKCGTVAVFIILLLVGFAQPALAKDATPDDMSHFEVLMGDWEADAVGQDGQPITYHVNYAWFDQSKRIVKSTVRMQNQAGQRTLLWEWFYGYHPEAKRLYAHGASTFGIFTRGQVSEFSEAGQVNEGSGLGPSGQLMTVRDVMTFNWPDAWTARTYLLRDGEWALVNEDHFRRASE